MTAIAPPSILQEIVAHNRGLLPAAKRREPLSALEARIRDRRPPKDFAAALKGDTIRIIAEVKSASPSAGVLRSRVNVNWNRDRGLNPDGSERINPPRR